jgi:hypothetical protein
LLETSDCVINDVQQTAESDVADFAGAALDNV